MLGSSIQHNSTARGLASRESEFEALLTDPGAATSISRVSASEFAADDATALAACAEPFLVAGTLTGWRGSERWHSVETLLDAYGHLTFSLAHDVTVTLREYAEYARSTGADCPYYLVERDAARARMARLVRAHLAGFENGAAGGASPHDAAGSFEPEAAVAAARRLVGFERALLERRPWFRCALGC